MLGFSGKGIARAVKLLSNWRGRQAFIESRTAYLAAQLTLAEIQQRIPEKPETRQYKASLRLYSSRGERGRVGYGVYAPAPTKTFQTDKTPSAIVYVRALPRVLKTDAAIPILQRFSPWTWDTLPRLPARGQAKVVVRYVRPGEADEVREQRRADMRKWRAAFAQAGVQYNPPTAPIQSVRGEEDIAFSAMRAEMGMSDGTLKPHWRPAVRNTKAMLARIVAADPLIRRAATDPTFDPRQYAVTVPAISSQEERAVQQFQKQLGIQ